VLVGPRCALNGRLAIANVDGAAPQGRRCQTSVSN